MEKTILSHLVCNEPYTRKVIAYLKEEYFHDASEKVVFKIVVDYFNKYNAPPTKEVLKVELDELTVPQQVYDAGIELINEIQADISSIDWLLESTEKFCKEKAMYNTIMESISIIDGTDKSRDVGSLPEMFQNALAVSFDTSIGHDFFENASDRFDFYNRDEERVPFHLEMLNKITDGGLVNKSLAVILAGTGVGKSLFMCDCAANNLMVR